MFIPFLVDGIATKHAWQRSSRDQPELCSNLGDNVTHTNCRKCFEGKGEMVQIVDPITGAVSAMDIDTPELPGGIDPTSFLFTVLSISVLFQAIAFISLGTLGDYADYRNTHIGDGVQYYGDVVEEDRKKAGLPSIEEVRAAGAEDPLVLAPVSYTHLTLPTNREV